VIAISPRLSGRGFSTLSFASTLYLGSILDLLTSEVPADCRDDLRLGLQEALVNAAKHGNNLDPGKTVFVRFRVDRDRYWWIISDQGSGFSPPQNCKAGDEGVGLPCQDEECGRGLYILYQIFDQVHWNPEGTELHLCKCVGSRSRLSFMSSP